MPARTEQIEALVRELPDPEAARLFYERVTAEHAQAARLFARDEGLLSDALALAAWSPFLATTLEQHPEYLQWLARERTSVRVKTREELGESLARFHLTHSQLDPQVILARFRRRELLRIYLRDIRRTNTLVEITEELSNLADAVLEHALQIARQDLDNRYGTPLHLDERARLAPAAFCIVALGKLGSYELNYASDIDLLFLYSDEGQTSGKGTRGTTTNREYFVRLAEMVAGLVGKASGEGAAYRVDLRLRPYGRDGALASSLEEAVRYYREKAQDWELQALIRARAAAGDPQLYARFADRVRHRVYRADETIHHALFNVRLAKQKIDRHQATRARGFNVKLGRGGIREIEFIAQALQLALGGRDDWLRAPHTLISLGRLADRQLITERERSELFDAYVFLRTLEHRLQMEHGLQTHTLPEDALRRALIARRMHSDDADAPAKFTRDLHTHTEHVRAAYDRIFGVADETETVETGEESPETSYATSARLLPVEPATDAQTAAAHSAATLFTTRALVAGSPFDTADDAAKVEETERALLDAAHASLNPRRALMLTARIASSLDKSQAAVELSTGRLRALVHLCGASEYFADMIAGNPALISALPETVAPAHRARDYRSLLAAAVEGEESFGAELSALRRAWAALLVETGAMDARGSINMREANRRQTELASASLDAGLLIARRELQRRYGKFLHAPRLAVLGLGRLGGGGVDYGSDLDVVLIYDDTEGSFIASLDEREAYGRLSELAVAALSSLTRDGSLYRVDLRLRPDGRNGPTVTGSRAFLDYLRERAVAWEWLAYVKLRAAAGARELGLAVEREARRVIHEAARRDSSEPLRAETVRVRERLEQERVRRKGRKTTDIKYGPGGMLDVYFATRFLQLRDDVPDRDEDRSTQATLSGLHHTGSLDDENYRAMSEGYAFLRSLDHELRLVMGRSTRLPTTEHPSLRDIAHKMNLDSTEALTKMLAAHMTNIRAAYERIMKSKG